MTEWQAGWRPPPREFASADPGKHHVGFALWRDSRLVHAVKLTTKRWPTGVVEMGNQAYAACIFAGMTLPIAYLIGEYPQIRFQADEEFKAPALIEIAHSLGAVAMGVHAQEYEHVSPSLWKGSLDGDTLIEERIKPKLTAEEHTRVATPEDHNTWDGIGVGLWRIGRLHPSRR